MFQAAAGDSRQVLQVWVELAGLRRTALHRLIEQTQQLDPFRFLIYAELAGAEIGPVQ